MEPTQKTKFEKSLGEINQPSTPRYIPKGVEVADVELGTYLYPKIKRLQSQGLRLALEIELPDISTDALQDDPLLLIDIYRKYHYLIPFVWHQKEIPFRACRN